MAKSVDGNHGEIRRTFRDAYCTVTDTHEVGGGFVDLVCGTAGVTIVSRTLTTEVVLALLASIGAENDCVVHDGANLLVEVKNGALPPSKRKLTPDEVEWHESWRGQKVIVKNTEEALRIIGAI